MTMRMPKTVNLPWYKIEVKQATRADVGKLLECKDGEEASDGFWDRDTKTIWICADLTLPQKRYVLAHELGHAWNDWMDTYLDTYTISEKSPETTPSALKVNTTS